jgi:hypothetical protein
LAAFSAAWKAPRRNSRMLELYLHQDLHGQSKYV